MTNLDLCYTPATELTLKYRNKELSPLEVMQNSLDRIDEVNGILNCFCFTYPEEALAKAKAAEQALASGKARPLEGIPLAIKDFTPARGKVTTRGSKLLDGRQTSRRGDLASTDERVRCRFSESLTTFQRVVNGRARGTATTAACDRGDTSGDGERERGERVLHRCVPPNCRRFRPPSLTALSSA